MPQTIVLIHGFPLDSTMWSHQAEFLRELGHTVITPDLPGFGGTPAWEPPKSRYTIEALADHVNDIIQTQGGGKAIVGGGIL